MQNIEKNSLIDSSEKTESVRHQKDKLITGYSYIDYEIENENLTNTLAEQKLEDYQEETRVRSFSGKQAVLQRDPSQYFISFRNDKFS